MRGKDEQQLDVFSCIGPARTTQHVGYAISQRKRKRVEECFGWLKRPPCYGKFGIVEFSRSDGSSPSRAAAYNLVRMRNLAMQAT